MSVNPAVNDPEVLETLYWHEDLSLWQIAERLDVSETTVYRRMVEFGIDRRGRSYQPNHQYNLAKKVRFAHHKSGYEVWDGSMDVDGFSTTFVHQLILVADGADPHKVYSDEWVTHHKNGVKWDNRPENLELMKRSEHGRLHANERDMEKCGEWCQYSDDELLSWIESFVEYFGYVPLSSEIQDWPGPAPSTYEYRFGNWNEAVRKAGYEPRRES